jgi:Glycosyl transferase family 2
MPNVKNSRRPLVSVILPSYNHAEFITAAVETVLNQKIQDMELIVVDDGSTDGTPDRVKKIKDSRIRLICMEQNRLHHPRNFALSMAEGRYIAFQNSDDLWLPGKLKAQIDIMEGRGKVVACFSGVELIDEKGEVAAPSWADGSFTTQNRTNVAWLRRFFAYGNCLCITSALVRHSALKKTGNFRGSLIQLSDLDLWVRLAAIGEFYIIEKKLSCMRIVPNKMSKKGATSMAVPFSTLNMMQMAARLIPAPIKPKIKMLMGKTGFHKKGFGHPNISSQSAPSLNLSAPGKGSINRSHLEFVDVLGNFVKSPILELIPRVFEDVYPNMEYTPNLRLAWLAEYAWSLNSVSHALFADRVMASILEDEAAIDEVRNAFGVGIIREFVRRRGQLSIKIDE